MAIAVGRSFVGTSCTLPFPSSPPRTASKLATCVPDQLTGSKFIDLHIDCTIVAKLYK